MECIWNKRSWRISWLICSKGYIIACRRLEVLEDFRNKCLEIYELDPIYFVSAPGLTWQACLKKTEVKLELITDYDMILMIEKGIRGVIWQATHSMLANNKYMNNYDKNSESSYIEYLDANNLYGWAINQKLPTNGFKWVEDLSQYNESLIKKYDENSYIEYFFEVDVEHLKRLFNLHKDLPFLPEKKKRWKSRKTYL